MVRRTARRRLPLVGASNFRDLGGPRTRDGHRVRRGLLYRSDALGDLSGGDVAYLARLRLRRVVDFRSPIPTSYPRCSTAPPARIGPASAPRWPCWPSASPGRP